MAKNRFSTRTDLAVEAREMIREKERAQGVKLKQDEEAGVSIDHVTVDQTAAEKLGKKAGTYITLYAKGVKNQDTKQQKSASQVLTKQVRHLLKKNGIKKGDLGLIVGLGNWQVTPDALGPMTVEKILVTKHLFDLEEERVTAGYRPVAAISPGVMGTTGMETSDVIFGIVEKLQPKFVIAIDALASRSIERINETIQLTDTGIHPGSGVGNKRKELSQETLNLPVLAIGVPTVVDAVTITSDTIDFLLKHFGREYRDKDRPSKALVPSGLSMKRKHYTEEDLPDEDKRQAVLGMIGNLDEEEKRALIEEVLTPVGYNLIVTPKEVDQYMEDMAHLIAEGINRALHEKVDDGNAASYTR